ncbi:cupin-like domain-containing protein [Scheffersomyces xylosifermentans]|uniref:cupin-like domain-containing protein n=1 Tax=Scheffersomyces xylosifermentans TaxID=1304137 RepID=UPI00315D0BDB
MSSDSRTTKKRATLASTYANYKIGKGESIEEIDCKEVKGISGIDFFNQYIKCRKPVVFKNYQGSSTTPSDDKSSPTNSVIDLQKFTPSNILETLDYSDDLQIEKKFKYGFGSGQKREKFSLNKLLDLFAQGNEDYYLTTQYDFDDPDLNESDDDDEDEDDNVASGFEIGMSGGSHSNEDESDEEDIGSHDDLGNADGNNEDFSDEGNAEDDDNDEELDDEEKLAAALAFSDVSSIDLEDLHDDFVDSDEDESHEVMVNEEMQITQSECDQRLKDLLQPPLTKLVEKPEILPIIPDLFSTLIPQQINLWMGYVDGSKPQSIELDSTDKQTYGLGKLIPGARKGTSSGLHHDHADNLYILVSGAKRFTLYSPADALKLQTVGTIYKLYNSGIIDYEVNEFAPDWKHIRDDGAIIEEITRWQLEKLDVNDKEGRAELTKQLQYFEKLTVPGVKAKSEKLDPPNFSKIPPALIHIEEFSDPETREKLTAFANEHFPGLLDLNKFTVHLEPGEMLYLPAGWFHEVSSFGADPKAATTAEHGNLTNVHIALNYWFIPPNGIDPEKCYTDSYWEEDWKRTNACIEASRTNTD